MPLHLLNLDLDCTQGIPEHLALFCDRGSLHDGFPELRGSLEGDVGLRVVGGRSKLPVTEIISISGN